jgi:hypothetical protein
MELSVQPKECQMDHEQLGMVADKFQWVFSASLLNACGKEAKFSQFPSWLQCLMGRRADRDDAGENPGKGGRGGAP